MTAIQNPAEIIAQLVLGRFARLRGLSASAPTTIPATTSDEAEPSSQSQFLMRTLQQATRQAWLALEVALAGKPLWKHLSGSLSTPEAKGFRQQMDALLDLLSLAGLPSEDAGERLQCADELRSARQASLAELVDPETHRTGLEAVQRNGSTPPHDPGDVERYALEELTAGLAQAGFPQLGRLLALRSPWNEPLFLEVVEYFYDRSMRADPLLVPDQTHAAAQPGGAPWRCLDRIARLLDEQAPAVEALLDHPEAIVAAEAGQSRAADDGVERFFQQGLRRYLRGDYRQAAVHFTAALKLDPTDARLYAHRGDAYRFEREYERAIADFEAALRLNPANPSVLVSRARAYLRTGEAARALVDCSAALESGAPNASAYRVRALACAELGELDPALDDLSKAIDLEPDEEEAYYERGLLYLRLREFPQAVEDFSWILEQNPHHLLAYEQRGNAYRFLKDYVGAIRDYGEILRRHPSDVLAYARRASAYQLKGDLDRALVDYQQALLLEPTNARVRAQLGLLFRKRGDVERAQSELDQAIRLDPENWVALYHRAKLSFLQGRCPEALADLGAALSRNAHLALGYLSRALIHDHVGHSHEALADSTEAVALDETLPAAYLVRGTVHAHAGTHEAAVADLSKALQLDERLALAYHERSKVYTLQEDYRRALADCDELLALDPGNALAYAHRSLVYQLLGEVEKSLLDYSRAMQLDPRCLIAAWDRSQAEAARLRSAQRLADYVDGMRPAASAAPVPSSFQIVLQPSLDDSVRLENRPVLSRTQGDTGSAAAKTEVPPNRRRTANDSTIQRVLPESRQASHAAAAPSRLASSVPEADSTPADHAIPPPPQPPPGRQYIEGLDDGDDLLVLDELESATPEAAPPGASPATVPATARAATPAPADVVPAPSAHRGPAGARRFPAPKADHEETVADYLLALEETVTSPPAAAPSSPAPAAGRLASTAAFPSAPKPAPAPPPRPATKPAPRPARAKASQGEEGTGLLSLLKKPRFLVAAGVAAVLLIGLGFRFNRSDHARVFPAQGQALFEGKPIPRATIWLEPVSPSGASFPRPHATSQDDGTFVLETYGEADGAPPGEYSVSVTLLAKPTDAAEAEGGTMPRNLLPRRYARFETSGLKMQIEPGENALPALRLTR
jgi:tetratricopeptide (TPR) repeat protein